MNYVRQLQVIVRDFMAQEKLSIENFAKRSPGLSYSKVQYVTSGKATSIDAALLAEFAQALRLPYNSLAARIGLLGATEYTRESVLFASMQKLCEDLSGVEKDIFLDKLERLIEERKRVSRKGAGLFK